jgi:hypothetical protein
MVTTIIQSQEKVSEQDINAAKQKIYSLLVIGHVEIYGAVEVVNSLVHPIEYVKAILLQDEVANVEAEADKEEVAKVVDENKEVEADEEADEVVVGKKNEKYKK